MLPYDVLKKILVTITISPEVMAAFNLTIFEKEHFFLLRKLRKSC